MKLDRYLTERTNTEKYTWDQINTALTMKQVSPKVILTILKALKKVKKENLTVRTI